ncbi:hypothetical protein ACFLXT_00905 [Chloroflexota bacterium]
MRSILRDPGAEVIVGVLSFFASFLAIGLALIGVKQVCYAYGAFAVSALLFIFAVIATISLLRYFAKTRGYIQQMGEYLRLGRQLRGELLSVKEIPQWTNEMQEKVPQWKAKVQAWLDNNLPDHALEFDLEGFFTDLDAGSSVNGEAANAAQHLEGRMGNLREILRDIRR